MPSFRQSSCSESWYSCFTVLTKNEEEILSLERRTGFLFRERRTIQQWTSFALTNLQPPISNPGLFYNSQIASCNWSFALSNPRPRFLQSSDPEQEHFSDRISSFWSDHFNLLALFFGFCLLACKRQHHFPGCPSGHHFFAPTSLTSCRRQRHFWSLCH